MEKYYVDRICNNLLTTDPEPMTAEEVERFNFEMWGEQCPSITTIRFDTLEEAVAYAEKQSPSSYWNSSYGKFYTLVIEAYAVGEDELNEDGEIDFSNYIKTYYASAEF